MNVPAELAAVFNRFSTQGEPFSEHDIADSIRPVIEQMRKAGKEVSWKLLAEYLAFCFASGYSTRIADWGTYFSPSMGGTDREGRPVVWPDIKEITPEMVIYWAERVTEMPHPVMRARYADLVWDFSRSVTGKRPDISAAYSAIDAYLEVADLKMLDHTTIHHTCRALKLSLGIGDTARTERAIEAVTATEDRIREVDALGTWGFAFDWLIEGKVPLRKEHRDKILSDLEGILRDTLEAVENGQSNFPFPAEHAALRLARFYRRVGAAEHVKRVLNIYGRVFITASQKVAAPQAAGWLRMVYDRFIEFGLNVEAGALSVRLRGLAREARGSLQPVAYSFQVTQQELQEFADALLCGSVSDALLQVAGHFTPDSKRLEQQVRDLAEHAPLLSIVQNVTVDAEGRELASIGSVGSDLHGRIVQQMSQNLHFEVPFLNFIFRELAQKHAFDAKVLIDFCSNSPLFDEARRGILQKGFDCYFAGDHVSAVHLLIPQIEHMLRRLLILAGKPTVRPGRHGGLNLRTLDDILSDPVVVRTFTERAANYLQVLLTDARGWNLRNDLAHGILEPDSTNFAHSDRVLHVFLLLGSVRTSDDSSSPSNMELPTRQHGNGWS